jgi:hypothetical protein
LYKDKFDLEVTCSSAAAMQAYLSGIECSLRFDRSGIDELAEAVAQDEEFALAHAALGRQLFTHGRAVESAAHLDIALSLKGQVTQREQDAIAVIAAVASANPQAIAMAQSHVTAWPQDVFVLAHLLGPFGLLAFSGSQNWNAQNVALLDATESAYPSDDWWRLTTRGFFCAEQGQLAQARKDCERAWSINKNGNCAHSIAHLHFEAGAIDEGRAFINDWVSEYGSQSDMRHHLIWHLAFLELESGAGSSQVFSWYDRELDPRVNDPTPLETLCDNASLVWRCHLSGEAIPVKVREELLQYAETSFASCGFAFADTHRAMAAALHPDERKLEDLLQQLQTVADNNGTRVSECVQQYAAGFGAFANEAYDDVVTILEPVMPDSVLLGGSNPQRRIVEDTYLEACMRSGRNEQARGILLGRNRETSAFDRKLLDRIGAGNDGR